MSDLPVSGELRELYPPDHLTITGDLLACCDEIDRLRAALASPEGVVTLDGERLALKRQGCRCDECTPIYTLVPYQPEATP